MQLYQILVPIISLFFIVRIFIQVRAKRRSSLSASVWYIFWGIIAFLAIAPDLISLFLAKSFGFADNVNAIIFVALGLIFLIIFYLSSTIDKIEAQLTELVRQIAINSVHDNPNMDDLLKQAQKSQSKEKSKHKVKS